MNKWLNPFLLLVSILAVLLVASCGPAQIGSRMDGAPRTNTYDGSFGRYYDRSADVVCWYLVAGGGLSCLPRSDTKLTVSELTGSGQ